ncbi:MAG: DUF4276 family protein [Anaerolineae bacterium]|nr:DUF4276 family protein [Anaerolineae bacterium]
MEFAREAGVLEYTSVRIVVTELEAWFLGDVTALEQVFPKIKKLRLRNVARYRQPDLRTSPAEDLDREIQNAGYSGYSKLVDSMRIAPFLNLETDHNLSDSFCATLARLKWLMNSSQE